MGILSERSPFIHFDHRAKRVVDLARRKAEELNSLTLSPEHLLLAVLSVAQGPGARAVAALCGSCAPAENAVADGLRAGEWPSPAHLRFAPATEESIVEAARQANLQEDNHIGTGHLLLGLLLAGGEPLTRRLSSVGVSYQAVSVQIAQMRRDGG